MKKSIELKNLYKGYFIAIVISVVLSMGYAIYTQHKIIDKQDSFIKELLDEKGYT